MGHFLARARLTGAVRWSVRTFAFFQGISIGVADGVGGWTESGVDPSLFSQALMYHAHRYSKAAWPGEPEVDPTQEYEEREQVEGWELSPLECLESAYGGVLRERIVVAGELHHRSRLVYLFIHFFCRVQYGMYPYAQRLDGVITRREVSGPTRASCVCSDIIVNQPG